EGWHPAPAVIETWPRTAKLFIVTLSLPLWSETATAETDGNVALDDPLTVVPVPETWRRHGETWLIVMLLLPPSPVTIRAPLKFTLAVTLPLPPPPLLTVSPPATVPVLF